MLKEMQGLSTHQDAACELALLPELLLEAGDALLWRMSVPPGDTACPKGGPAPCCAAAPPNRPAMTSLLQLHKRQGGWLVQGGRDSSSTPAQHPDRPRADLLMLTIPSKENEECYLCLNPTDARGNPCLA